MSSKTFVTVGTGELLPRLRGNLKNAKTSLWIICPWIDGYFADEVTKVAPDKLSVRLVVRPQHTVEDGAWRRIIDGVERFRNHFAAFEVRTEERLHAKAIVIDGRVGYVGSANFYRYSLENSCELVVRGPLDAMGDLERRMEAIFDDAKELQNGTSRNNRERVQRTEEDGEIMDPIVEKILADNPKAWVIGPVKRQHRGR